MKLQYLWKSLKFVYKQDIKLAVLNDVLFILFVLLEMGEIATSGYFIDETLKLLNSWSSFTLYDYFITDSFWYLCIATLLLLLGSIISHVRPSITQVLNKKFLLAAQSMVIDKLSTENLEEIESKEFQDLAVFVPAYSYLGIFTAYTSFSEFAMQLFRSLTVFIIISRSLGISTLLIVLFAIPQAYIEGYYKHKYAKYFEKATGRIKMIQYIDSFIRDINNFIELKVHRTFYILKKRYLTSSNIYNRSITEISKHSTIDRTLFDIIGQALIKGYVVYVIYISIIKRFTIGHFKATYDYILSLYTSVSQMLLNYNIMSENVHYIEKFFQFVEYKGFADLIHGDVKLGRATPKLEFRNVDFQFPDNKDKSLENWNFTINPGEKVCFVGGDGSGKTTFVKLLCGLYRVTAGDYTINGYSIYELGRNELKKKIAVVPQNFNNYYFSIKENVILGKKFNSDRYNDVKRICEIDKFLKKEGIDDDQILGKYFPRGREISPGYWERIAIARALYLNRQILVLDESFTYIDEEAGKRILKGIVDYLGESKTLLYIAQDSQYLSFFDKVMFLKSGKIVKKRWE